LHVGEPSLWIHVSELEVEIARVRNLDLSRLRARWESVFRRKPPDHLPRHLLFRMIVYRLQAERLGDLDRDTQRFLDCVVVREWDGKSQRVMVEDGGFAWNGTTDRVAFAMTGTRWSGPRFFGLRRGREKPA
jgi:hypothetical protein